MTGITAHPEKEFKIGQVRVAIWANQQIAKDGKVYDSPKVTIDRAYKDFTGNQKSNNALDLNDIPKAILALKKAFEYLTAPKQTRHTENNAATNNTAANAATFNKPTETRIP